VKKKKEREGKSLKMSLPYELAREKKGKKKGPEHEEGQTNKNPKEKKATVRGKHVRRQIRRSKNIQSLRGREARTETRLNNIKRKKGKIRTEHMKQEDEGKRVVTGTERRAAQALLRGEWPRRNIARGGRQPGQKAKSGHYRHAHGKKIKSGRTGLHHFREGRLDPTFK